MSTLPLLYGSLAGGKAPISLYKIGTNPVSHFLFTVCKLLQCCNKTVEKCTPFAAGDDDDDDDDKLTEIFRALLCLHLAIQTHFVFHSLDPMPVNKKTHESVTVAVGRDRKIQLRTNHMAGFVTLPSWKKLKRDLRTFTAATAVALRAEKNHTFCLSSVRTA